MSKTLPLYYWVDEAKCRDSNYWHTQVTVWELGPDSVESVEDAISQCKDNPGNWTTPEACERQLRRVRSLRDRGVTHILRTTWAPKLGIRYQHYDTARFKSDHLAARDPESPLRDRYCDARFEPDTDYSGLLASTKLLARLTRAMGSEHKWDHPAYVLDALTRLRGKQARSVAVRIDGFPWSDYALLDPAVHAESRIEYTLTDAG
jgi:hypothetical protein